jgi:hypothetical protein
MMGTLNMHVGAVAVPAHPHDRARQLERARILLSGAAEELVDAIDLLLPRVRKLVDRYDPPELPLAS